MKRFIPRAVVALLLPIALTGCAALMRQAFVAPTISVSDVRLAGVGTQGGTINQRVTLLQKDSAKVRVPVTFGLKEVMVAGQQLSKTGSLPFKIDGEVTVETAFGNIRRAFVQNGTYDGMNFSLLPPKR